MPKIQILTICNLRSAKAREQQYAVFVTLIFYFLISQLAYGERTT